MYLFFCKIKYSIRIILLSACIWLLAYSCRKKDNTDSAVVYPINSYVKNYYDFQQGSYWIYKDSLTGDIDSFAGVSYLLDTKKQEIHVLINEFHNDTTGILVSIWALTLIQDQAFLNYKIDAVNEVDYMLCYPLFQAIPLSFSEICHDSVYTEAQFLTPYVVNGNSYDSVYTMFYAHHIDSCYDYSENDRLFTAKGIGFVKMNLSNYVHRNWELQRYKIIQ